MIKNFKRGLVVSKSGDKTVKVLVRSRKAHKKYKKVINVNWSVLVHDEKNTAQVGDTIDFISCRPISNLKKFRLANVLGK